MTSENPTRGDSRLPSLASLGRTEPIFSVVRYFFNHQKNLLSEICSESSKRNCAWRRAASKCHRSSSPVRTGRQSDAVRPLKAAGRASRSDLVGLCLNILTKTSIILSGNFCHNNLNFGSYNFQQIHHPVLAVVVDALVRMAKLPPLLHLQPLFECTWQQAVVCFDRCRCLAVMLEELLMETLVTLLTNSGNHKSMTGKKRKTKKRWTNNTMTRRRTKMKRRRRNTMDFAHRRTTTIPPPSLLLSSSSLLLLVPRNHQSRRRPVDSYPIASENNNNTLRRS